MHWQFLLQDIRGLKLDLARLDPRAGMPVMPPSGAAMVAPRATAAAPGVKVLMSATLVRTVAPSITQRSSGVPRAWLQPSCNAKKDSRKIASAAQSRRASGALSGFRIKTDINQDSVLLSRDFKSPPPGEWDRTTRSTSPPPRNKL